jgi:DNA replication and repair protein RecF
MTLSRLFIQNLRNLSLVDIVPSPQINLFFGENGSGKTSILEAINMLAVGRSFRSHKHKPLISQAETQLTVFGKVKTDNAVDLPLGVSRHLDGTANFKAGGVNVASAADLAAYLPVQTINAETFLLMDGAPKVRRQFIDWLVFHVEPSFFPLWKGSQRCLKHRNSLLRRDRIDPLELATWDQELAQLTHQIDLLRSQCVEQLKAKFYAILKEFLDLDGLSISYYRGWDKDKAYADVLAANLARDQQQGFTQTGHHRADLRISQNGQNAADILSRGQQKLLVCALKIAQGLVLSELSQRKCIYLVDDLPAELDIKHRQALAGWLEKMNTQVFVTGIEKDSLTALWQSTSDLKLFHVKQGRVEESTNTLPELAASVMV